MQTYPLVSFVVPAYNVAPYIAHCVDSILNQTYPNIEVVIINDGSTDETPAILQDRYGDHPRVRCFHQSNQGVSASRNRGIMEARGEFVHFLDGDDFVLPEKTSKSYALFQKNPDTGVVYGPGTPVMPDMKTKIPFTTPPLPSGYIFCEWLTGTMANGVYGVTDTFMVRRQHLIDAGLFDETMGFAEDWDLWLRLSSRYPFAALDEALACYVRRPDGQHKYQLKMAQGRLRAIQKARHLPGRERCLDDAAYDRLEAGRWHVVASRLWQAGRRTEARAAFGEAINLHSGIVRRLLWWGTFFLPADIMTWIDRVRVQRKPL